MRSWFQRRAPIVYSRLTALVLLSVPFSPLAIGQTKTPEGGQGAKATRPATRLIWQDDSDCSIRWSDLTRIPMGYDIAPQAVVGFPKLDSGKQSLVQMEGSSGLIVVGVHDNEEGVFQSGWIAMNTGVTEEEHGDHSHWSFGQPPKVTASHLGTDQGNPAHVYEYQGDIYLANDKKNGFTILPTAAMLKSPVASLARFVSGGGNHITLAVVDRKVGYATWTDRDGENKGRVDVVAIDKASRGKGYRLDMPSGGLHGATTNSGRVFFAPSDGVCWVDADVNLTSSPAKVDIHHLSLGEDPTTGKPMRTGAFANHDHFVLFATGTQDAASLCMIDAKTANPTLLKLTIPIAEGLALTTPSCVKTATGKSYAFLFSDRRGSDATESMIVVDLDPNSDGLFADAKVAKMIPVGPSKVEGHGGHHDVCFSPNRRLACITNPGDGTIWVMTLADLEIASKNQVKGTPTKILAYGG